MKADLLARSTGFVGGFPLLGAPLFATERAIDPASALFGAIFLVSLALGPASLLGYFLLLRRRQSMHASDNKTFLWRIWANWYGYGAAIGAILGWHEFLLRFVKEVTSG